MDAIPGMTSPPSRRSLTGAGLLLALTLLGACQSAPTEFVPGRFNVLDVARSDREDMTYRAINSFAIQRGDLALRYLGLNVIDGDLDMRNYRGAQTVALKIEGVRLIPLVRYQTDEHGVNDTKLGFRDRELITMLGGRGFLQLTANDESAQAAVLYRRPLGHDLLGELFHNSIGFEGRGPRHQTDVQLNYYVTTNVALFSRLRFDGLDSRTALVFLGVRLDALPPTLE